MEPAAAPSEPRSATLPVVGAFATQPRSLHIVTWKGPSIEPGIDPRSSYVETFWLPVLGPSATWLLRRLADESESQPEGFDLDLDEVAMRLGLRKSASRHAPLTRALARCVRFGLARWVESNALAVRRHLPAVPRRHVLGFPIALQEEHRQWRASSALESNMLIRRRARLVALDLRELCVDVAGIERHLLRRGVHPAVAFDAARWAWSPPTDHADHALLVHE